MSSSYEKSVRGGTKVKIAAPKSKYVEHILTATQAGEAGVAEVFRTLVHRLRDSTWTVAFKSLIIVHLMIKEGAPDVTLSYLSEAPKNRLAINSFTDVQTQGHNIRHYAAYLVCRATVFGATKYDYARGRDERLKRMTVDKGLLRETELVQAQIKELLSCDLLTAEADNEISLTAFRLLTGDLLDLFHVENEAVMNVLSHYFEMSRPDAERAIKIYRKFCAQTGQVVQYLSVARQYEHATHLEVPRIKHAPTSLAKSLQDYLDDKDFEVNRRQYLAEQEAKRTGRPVQKPVISEKAPESSVQEVTKSAATITTAPVPPTKGPAPEMIDFFESIEQNQQTMGQSPQPFPQMQGNVFIQQQQTGFQNPQLTALPQNGFNVLGSNPFLQVQQQQQQQLQLAQPIQTQFTGAGFGGFGPQPQQSQPLAGGAFPPQQVQSFYDTTQQIQSPVQPLGLQQTGLQASNPFRQSVMPMPTGDASAAFGPPQRQNTNPFARNTATPPVPAIPENAFSPTPLQQQPQLLQSQPTGTNPFARALPAQQTSQTVSPPPPNQNLLQVQPTGSTNPFRQSAFVNQTFQTGWQNVPQGTMGGFESLETIPIFPRPGQSTPQQQQPWN